jgi:hypothetical protein
VIHESLGKFHEAGRRHGSWEQAEADLARLSNSKRVAHRHDLVGKKQAADYSRKEAGGNLRTNLFHIRRFFANPLEYHLSKTLGIEIDEEPATMSATDEPLDSGMLAISILQKKIWSAILASLFPEKEVVSPDDIQTLAMEAETIAGRVYDEHIAAGQSPEAQFCRMEKNFILQWAKQCAGETISLRETFRNHRLVENIDISLGRENAAGELTVDIDDTHTCVIECTHGMVLLPRNWGNEGNNIGIMDIRKNGKASENPGLWLSGVIQHMAEQNRGRSAQTAIKLIQLNRDDGDGPNYKDARIKQESDMNKNINEWFPGFLKSMLIKRSSDHLPFASVNKLFGDDWKNITGEALNDELGGEHSDYRCYLEAFKLTDARIPELGDEELRSLARERFAPMLEGWLHE